MISKTVSPEAATIPEAMTIKQPEMANKLSQQMKNYDPEFSTNNPTKSSTNFPNKVYTVTPTKAESKP